MDAVGWSNAAANDRLPSFLSSIGPDAEPANASRRKEADSTSSRNFSSSSFNLSSSFFLVSSSIIIRSSSLVCSSSSSSSSLSLSSKLLLPLSLSCSRCTFFFFPSASCFSCDRRRRSSCAIFCFLRSNPLKNESTASAVLFGNL